MRSRNNRTSEAGTELESFVEKRVEASLLKPFSSRVFYFWIAVNGVVDEEGGSV